MVFKRHGGTEQRHDLVAHDLVHRALIAVDGLHHGLEHRIEDLACLFGISVSEQLTADPESVEVPRGISFERHPDAWELAERSGDTGRLVVREIRQGISIETTSFVGALALGPIQLRIRPKLRGAPLLTLLRYAYGLRHLDLFPAAGTAIDHCGFEDLLLFQFAAEVTELISRGLLRSYVPRERWLPTPRGRVDFNQLCRTSGVTRAALPCRSHHRLADCLPNQALLAGLQHGVRAAGEDSLRMRLRHLAGEFGEQMTPVNLDRHALTRLRQQMTRLTRAYEPAVRLIELIVEGQGAALEAEASKRLPGFLFDMNRFFETLVVRFLTDHLGEADVQGQARLQDIFEYDPEFNPRNRRSPRPRPDLMVRRTGHATQLLDAKYRDLWEHPLPREMLYQLSVYTLSHAGDGTGTILSPTISPAREARIVIRDPIGGRRLGLVILRPVRLDKLAELVSSRLGVLN